jgi:hypothetical protein
MQSKVFQDRAFCERVATLGLQCGELLNQIHQLGEATLPSELHVEFRRSLGPLFGHLNTDLLMPIFARYPDLEPPEST